MEKETYLLDQLPRHKYGYECRSRNESLDILEMHEANTYSFETSCIYKNIYNFLQNAGLWCASIFSEEIKTSEQLSKYKLFLNNKFKHEFSRIKLFLRYTDYVQQQTYNIEALHMLIDEILHYVTNAQQGEVWAVRKSINYINNLHIFLLNPDKYTTNDVITKDLSILTITDSIEDVVEAQECIDLDVMFAEERTIQRPRPVPPPPPPPDLTATIEDDDMELIDIT